MGDPEGDAEGGVVVGDVETLAGDEEVGAVGGVAGEAGYESGFVGRPFEPCPVLGVAALGLEVVGPGLLGRCRIERKAQCVWNFMNAPSSGYLDQSGRQ